MSKVYVKTESLWYAQLASVSNYYESDIENRIFDHANETFNGYFVVPFKKILNDSAGRSSTPDLALIRKDYTNWYIVEVELFTHDKTHPTKQIDVFLDAKYDAKEITEYFIGKDSSLDKAALLNLTSTVQPCVMVIVDGPSPTWMESFKKKGVLVCVFEVYKNSVGTELFRLKGDYPYIVTAECHLKQHASNTYEVIDPAFLSHNHGDNIDVYYSEKKMSGKIHESRGKKYLIIQNNLIPPRKDLILFKDISNNLLIRLN